MELSPGEAVRRAETPAQVCDQRARCEGEREGGRREEDVRTDVVQPGHLAAVAAEEAGAQVGRAEQDTGREQREGRRSVRPVEDAPNEPRVHPLSSGPAGMPARRER